MTDSPKTWKRVSDNLILHIPSGMYYVRKFRAGKGRLFKTTGEIRKGHAQSKANDMISEWLYGKNRLTTYAPISEVCDKLLLVLEQDFYDGKRAKKTWEHDRVYLKQVKALFGKMLIAELDETFLDNWTRTTGRKTGKTLGCLFKYISKMLAYAHLHKLIDRKPRIKDPDPKAADVSIYTSEQIQALLAAADPEMKDMIILGAECGMRPYEIRQLKWDMVEFKKLVTIRLPEWFTKTRTAREFVVGPSSSDMLRRRRKDPGTEYVFPSQLNPHRPVNEMTFSKHWRKLVLAAELPAGSKFHWLRHTFFTRALLEAEKPLPMVAAYGGNSPKILYDRYLSKQASHTSDVAGSVEVSVKVTGEQLVKK